MREPRPKAYAPRKMRANNRPTRCMKPWSALTDDERSAAALRPVDLRVKRFMRWFPDPRAKGFCAIPRDLIAKLAREYKLDADTLLERYAPWLKPEEPAL